MRHFTRALWTLLVPVGVLVLALSGAAAQDRLFAHDGIWAANTCRLPIQAFFQFAHVRVDFKDNAIEVNSAERVLWKGRYRISAWQVRRHRSTERIRKVAVEWLEGGRLHGRFKLFEPDDYRKFASPRGELETLREPPADWERTLVFEKCETLPASYSFVHGMAASFAERFRAIVPACAKDAQACAERVVSMFDVSGNGKLSRAEVARGLRLASYFATIAAKSDGKGFPVVVPDREMMVAESLATVATPLVASSLVAGNDYDNDGELSLKEIFADFRFGIDRFHDDFQKLDHGIEALFKAALRLRPLIEAFGSKRP